MLEDVDAHRQTEIELITGSLVREAEKRTVPVPLHALLYALVRGKEASWSAHHRQEGRHEEARKSDARSVAAAAAAVAVVGGGTAASEQAKTVTIGWAYDGVGAMAPFDGPASRPPRNASAGQQGERDKLG